MINLARLLFLIFIFLFLASCSSLKTKEISGDNLAQDVQEILYGDVTTKKGQSLITEKPHLIKEFLKFRPDFHVLPGDDILCSKETQHQLNNGSSLLIYTCKNMLVADCENCPVVWGAATVAKKSNGNFEILNSRPFVGTLGSYGQLPKSSLIKIGLNIWALRFDEMARSQASETKVMSLYSLEEDFHKILSIDLEGNNSSNCGVKTQKPCYKFFSELKPTIESEGYGNIRIWYNGTEPIPGDLSLIRSAERLLKLCYVNGVYQRICSQ